MKRYIVFLFCILTGLVLFVGGSVLSAAFFGSSAAALPTASVPLPTVLVTNTVLPTPTNDQSSVSFRILELPDDMAVPQYYTSAVLQGTECYAFTDALGNVCYRVYGEIAITSSDGTKSSIFGFFTTDEKLEISNVEPVNPETENYGAAKPCNVLAAAVVQGYKKISGSCYYFMGPDKEKVYRTYAAFGGAAPAFYPSGADGEVAPGALKADIQADVEAMDQAGLPVSVATAPHVMLDTIEVTTLINMNNRLDKSYIPSDLVSVGEYLTLAPFTMRDNPTFANPEALNAFIAMINAAYNEAGIDSFYLCNVYRSYANQTENWTSRVKADASYGTNPNKAIGSAYPGTSEHQTGLAFDITCLSHKTPGPGYASTAEAKWMAKNAWRFGFILRYQKGKERITSIKYEPYHYRYVGCELAKYLFDNDLALEEYYDAEVVWSGSLH